MTIFNFFKKTEIELSNIDNLYNFAATQSICATEWQRYFENNDCLIQGLTQKETKKICDKLNQCVDDDGKYEVIAETWNKFLLDKLNGNLFEFQYFLSAYMHQGGIPKVLERTINAELVSKYDLYIDDRKTQFKCSVSPNGNDIIVDQHFYTKKILSGTENDKYGNKKIIAHSKNNLISASLQITLHYDKDSGAVIPKINKGSLKLTNKVHLVNTDNLFIKILGNIINMISKCFAHKCNKKKTKPMPSIRNGR